MSIIVSISNVPWMAKENKFSRFIYNNQIRVTIPKVSDGDFHFMDMLVHALNDIDWRVMLHIDRQKLVIHSRNTYTQKNAINDTLLADGLCMPLPLTSENYTNYTSTINKPAGEFYCADHIILKSQSVVSLPNNAPFMNIDIPEYISLKFSGCNPHLYITDYRYAHLCPVIIPPIDDTFFEVTNKIFSRGKQFTCIVLEIINDTKPCKLQFNYQSYFDIIYSLENNFEYLANELQLTKIALSEGKQCTFQTDNKSITGRFVSHYLRKEFNIEFSFYVSNDGIRFVADSGYDHRCTQKYIQYFDELIMPTYENKKSIFMDAFLNEKKKK